MQAKTGSKRSKGVIDKAIGIVKDGIEKAKEAGSSVVRKGKKTVAKVRAASRRRATKSAAPRRAKAATPRRAPAKTMRKTSRAKATRSTVRARTAR